MKELDWVQIPLLQSNHYPRTKRLTYGSILALTKLKGYGTAYTVSDLTIYGSIQTRYALSVASCHVVREKTSCVQIRRSDPSKCAIDHFHHRIEAPESESSLTVRCLISPQLKALFSTTQFSSLNIRMFFFFLCVSVFPLSKVVDGIKIIVWCPDTLLLRYLAHCSDVGKRQFYLLSVGQ